GRNRFHRPRVRASAFSSSITGGWKCGSPESCICFRNTCSAGYTCSSMKATSSSRRRLAVGDSEKSMTRTLGSAAVTVSFEQDGSVAVIGLDDGKANAITMDVLAAIDDGLAQARDSHAGAVLITGRPGRFSAGFDLSVMTSGEGPMRELVTAGAETLM